MLRVLVIFSLAITGFIHILIAPGHFAHAPAHGIFFGLIGVVQLAWAGAFGRWPTPRLAWVGLALSGAVVLLWGLTQAIATPFAAHAEPIDWATIVTKGAEIVGFVGLLGLVGTGQVADMRRLSVVFLVQTCAVLLIGAGGVWGGGLIGTGLFPQLGHADEQGHDHASHDHAHDHTGHVPAYEDAATAADDGYDWGLPHGFPLPTVPEDNPMTAAKVELGRHLFYDTRLSGNGTQSCASCHRQDIAFTDDRELAIGSTDEVHPRNAQTLTNVAYNATLTWANPTLTQLERQILVPMFGEFPRELGITGKEGEVLARFQQDPQYQALFREAFPDQADPVQWHTLVKALASFNRALISGNSAYDQYVYQGDKTALSPSARRGMDLFLSERLECHHCHAGFNFTLSTRHTNTSVTEAPFHNTGLYNVDGNGAYPRGNTGLSEITGNPDDMGHFRAPTLRNIALTAPYMHDGSMATLEEVIRFYADGGRHITSGEHAGDGRLNPYKSGFVAGFTLTDQELEDLIAFLHSLTDEEFITDPRFSDPFAESE